MDFDWEQYQYLGYAGIIIIMVIWLLIVITGFAYFARCAFTSGEKFRLSFIFALLGIFNPAFSVVPICLNAKV